MKKTKLIIIALIISMAAAGSGFADGWIVRADYNAITNTESAMEKASIVDTSTIDGSISFGAAYRFWGIFLFEANMYTNFIFGGDNFFGIRQVLPLDLFSAGFGMHIPMGGIALDMDWQRFFSGIGSAEQDISQFSNSFKIGVMFNLNPGVGFEVYNRKLFAFQSADPSASINMLGMGLAIKFD